MKPLKDAIVYQIYPASFKDTNNDGFGDLKGILSKLHYLKSLGVDYLWLSPIYASPMVDMGYDISDYKAINPKMGTMADFEELVKEAHSMDMGIIMDLVMNHTSNQHPWFKQALADPNSKYRDYYLFKRAKEGQKAPNNWTTSMGNPAWEKVDKDTFYLHLFSKEQPDLNWSNPEVLKEFEDIIRFWLQKGVSGFRCDMIDVIYKESFADGTKKVPSMIGQEHYLCVEGNHRLLKKIQDEVIKPNHSFLIGETFNVSLEQANRYLNNGELDELFEFETVSLGQGLFSYKVKPEEFKDSILKWQKELKFNAIYLENHDQKRSVGRFVSDENPIAGAKLLLTLLLTLKGTPFIYQGEELGARNYRKPNPFESTDMVAKGILEMLRNRHVPKFIQKSATIVHLRDDARAPMAFENTPSFGFTSPDVKPWQEFNDFSSTINVACEEKEANSVLNTFKILVSLRKGNQALVCGDFQEIPTFNKGILAYLRTYKEKRILFFLTY